MQVIRLHDTVSQQPENHSRYRPNKTNAFTVSDIIPEIEAVRQTDGQLRSVLATAIDNPSKTGEYTHAITASTKETARNNSTARGIYSTSHIIVVILLGTIKDYRPPLQPGRRKKESVNQSIIVGGGLKKQKWWEYLDKIK